MKSVELHIAQVESEPNRLYWKLSNDGITTSGIFEVSTPDDVARFTACAAHVFNQIKTFKKHERCPAPGCQLDAGHLDAGLNHFVFTPEYAAMREAFIGKE